MSTEMGEAQSLSKGLGSRRMELHWIMLAHNLRVLARRCLREQAAREAQKTKAGHRARPGREAA